MFSLKQPTPVLADQLVGPRVYSTDLSPTLLDRADATGSARVAARALKIKALTKGTVTLNAAFLITPLAVLLFRDHPDLLAGETFLPAVRQNARDLSSLRQIPLESFEQLGIKEEELADHVARLERSIGRVMPWNPEKIGDHLKASITTGLRNDLSPISRALSELSFDTVYRSKLIGQIEALELSKSQPLRDLVSAQPPLVTSVLAAYTTACYHAVGTSVVRCEAGTDLSPLSAFKASDAVLAARDARLTELSDDGIFLQAFLASALGAMNSGVVPAEVVDRMTFSDVHGLSAALRKQGFQHKYEDVLRQSAAAIDALTQGGSVADVNFISIASAAKEVAETFDSYIDGEVSHHGTREHDLVQTEFIETATDLSKHLVTEGLAAAIPFVGTVVAAVRIAGMAIRTADQAASAAATQVREAALADAKLRRDEEAKAVIARLAASRSGVPVLLEAAAALEDMYHVRTRRA